MQIKSEKVSRFNINRADIWDGALRGFKRSSFDPAHTILVKFSDNTGYMESGIDTGGPKREFLELLMQHLKDRTLFEGRETEKYLTCDSAVECLRSIVEVHATMLMIAGCLCHVIRELSDKDKIVEDYLKWYFFTRNAACIQRFKEGLATLNVLEAMKQNPSGFMKYFCFSEKKITAEIIENLFKAEFSQPGSNRRQEELRIAAYWADYLLDIEGLNSSIGENICLVYLLKYVILCIVHVDFHLTQFMKKTTLNVSAAGDTQGSVHRMRVCILCAHKFRVQISVQ
ncbi:G2E3 ligase, partial [Polypterus senegalus]